MLGKFEWIEILSGLLSIKTRLNIGRFFIVCNALFFVFFPTQYIKYVGIATSIFIEQYQKGKMEALSPVIDNYINSIKH
ncbi:MAG: hypothetical protein UR60_C0013G0002 [Candidatus Moranbacteria bacterium GW2011_GWF2_34_56]|nr:MAG: hypothetical protein UR51_C0004G0023 [Candidatus Moranbacteria bacterium GW2011_GWF1_34_10]KKP64866.1 MAG: hypothetical protein UR60_C0013G0002 [Candidatus Moranbacteria bacterium GW2011_GWF2_34_56]HBI16585.1 hypothetical protein [Candidatus Moranbacteria bacterium]